MADDALARYLANKFPTANPTVGYSAPAFPHDDGGDLTGSQQTPRNGPGTTPTVPTINTGPGGGDSSGGGGGSSATPLDWHAYLVNWGFTQDIVDELDRIFRTYSDPNQASAAALAYVRGTDWYKQTFPGISEGLAKGVISNEQDYRSYTNNLNDLYQRYYGRNVTGDEVAGYLGKGYSASRTGQFLGGQAYAKTYGGDVQYLLGATDENGTASADQLQALGEENSGLDSLMGQQLQRRLDLARQRLAGLFQGQLATPSMRLLNYGRPAAPSLQGGISSDDVGA